MSMLRDTWPQAQLVVQRALAGGSVLVQRTQRWRLGRLRVCVAVPKGRRRWRTLDCGHRSRLLVRGEVPDTAVQGNNNTGQGPLLRRWRHHRLPELAQGGDDLVAYLM